MGCDYLENIKGLGFVKIISLYNKHKENTFNYIFKHYLT